MAHEARIAGTVVRTVAADITRRAEDVIVTAANRALAGGGGVDGAVHAAAGPGLLEELRARYPDGCPTGSAVITSAGRLPARWVVHAVGPVYRDGTRGEAELLAGAHRASIDLAAAVGARSIAFPAISCGVYGYPVGQAAPVAVTAVTGWLTEHRGSGIEAVTFALWGPAAEHAFDEALAAIDPWREGGP